PKTLLFSPITPEYLADNAADWKRNGFDGFLLSSIMSNWADDIWATDGDARSRGKRDSTYQAVRNCNEQCSRIGIEDNFIKIAFYSHVPDWTDENAWGKLNENFQEAARFARLSGCRGIALDIEYVSEQYEFDWEGYSYKGYNSGDLRKAAVARGIDIVEAMLAAYPDMTFLTLPEGITYYGPLAGDFFKGMVIGMAGHNAPGGLHVLTEASYSMTSTLGLLHYARTLEVKILDLLDEKYKIYWKKHCSISLGGWPLGYYRRLVDEDGRFLGYGGREETFGNQVVGSYADKSGRFTPDEFRSQYAGLLLGSGHYCWIYGHGATWWQITESEAEKYGNSNNALLP
ncbi:hypothetical protein BVY01_02010, partial [bacterium I07]